MQDVKLFDIEDSLSRFLSDYLSNVGYILARVYLEVRNNYIMQGDTVQVNDYKIEICIIEADNVKDLVETIMLKVFRLQPDNSAKKIIGGTNQVLTYIVTAEQLETISTICKMYGYN